MAAIDIEDMIRNVTARCKSKACAQCKRRYMPATRNKHIVAPGTTRNKKLLVTSATLLVTSALLVVTRS